MSTLFIIDQSLKEMGGHHFDYTRLIADAAVHMGITPVIGTHRLLQADAEQELERYAQVEKVFRETTYTRLSHLAGLKELVATNQESCRRPDPEKGRVYNFFAHRARRKRIKKRSQLIRQFAEDCDSFFQRFSIDETDHVLFTTISELEFMGLAAFLGTHPRSIQATWHTQFHFSMFSGRPDEFASQSREEQLLCNAFQSALARIPYHELRAWTTSGELASQYNRMKLLAFEPLPYPVNPQLFADSTEARRSQFGAPIKIAVTGGVRREKRQKTGVHQLINSIWDSHLVSGNVQLNIQSGSPKTFSCKRILKNRGVDRRQYENAIRIHPHPLPEPDYVDFIRHADAGLFCYDSRRYYSRRAGILSEFLSCGKPVIVPAGSWLSQQIAKPAGDHVRKLVQQTSNRQTVGVTNLKWEATNAPLSGNIISFDQTRNPFHCRFDRNKLTVADPRGVAIGFRWQWPREAGSYVEIELACFDEQGHLIESDRQIASHQPDQPDSLVFHRIPANCEYGTLTFRNAFTESSISIASVEISFLDFGGHPEPARSAVGIIAADEAMITSAVNELVAHYNHYLDTAVGFSRQWASAHDPVRTVKTLVPTRVQVRHAA